jgi:hypothetical protein
MEVAMRRLLFAMLTCLSLCSLALAQEGPPKEGTTAEPPKGYETFFKEMSKVMQSYPEAAKRFSIIDKKVRSELHHCDVGETWGCIEVCSDWPHCTSCALWGCKEILK